MRMIPRPDAASSEMIRWTSTLAPMSMPRVGSSRIRTLRLRRQPLRQHDLLLVAARQGADELVDAGHPDVELLGVVVGDAALGRRPDEQAREEARQDRQRHVLGDREVEDQALLVAVLGEVGDPGVHRRRRAREVDRLPAEPDLAGVALVDPEQDPGDLGPAGADEPGEADDLAGPDREADVAERARPGSGPRPRGGRRRSASRPWGRATRPGRPCAGRGRRWSARSSAVVMTCRPSRKTVARSHRSKTSSRRWLTNRIDDAAIAEAADDREQPLDLVGRQRRRRLVEDEDAGVDRQRLGDLDELLVGHRQAADGRADVEPDVELVEQRLRRPARRAPVDRCRSDPTARGR